MKKLLFILLTAAIFSCNSNKKDDKGSENNMPAVKNVNGNIPDTTNSVDITGKDSTSSTNIDSSHH